LEETVKALNAKPRADWSKAYFQYSNRLAFLHFLRREDGKAHLLFVDFIEDYGTKGPATDEAWKAAFASADYVLGLSARHKFTSCIHHVHPSVIEIKNETMDETAYLLSSSANTKRLKDEVQRINRGVSTPHELIEP